MKIVKFSQKKSSSGTSSSGSSSGGGSSSGSGGSSITNDWFYIDSDSIVHCKYDFAGDGEVSAYSDSSAGPSTLYQIKNKLGEINNQSTLGDVIAVLGEIRDLI